MASSMSGQRDPPAEHPPLLTANSRSAGVCMMNSKWRDAQHRSFIDFISSFLHTNSFRLNSVPIAPDFIFNCGGLSVAFVFVTNWNCNDTVPIFTRQAKFCLYDFSIIRANHLLSLACRIHKLKGQFANLYVVVSLPTKNQNDSFVRSYFENGMELGKPVFVPVLDLEMGFEKIVKIAHSRGVSKQQGVVSKLKAERKRSVQGMDIFLRVITSIPSIDNHDANALSQAIGSIEAIAKASKEDILESTDLSTEKAAIIARFFRDPNFYLSPKFN